jgi:hypothetical protein
VQVTSETSGGLKTTCNRVLCSLGYFTFCAFNFHSFHSFLSLCGFHLLLQIECLNICITDFSSFITSSLIHHKDLTKKFFVHFHSQFNHEVRLSGNFLKVSNFPVQFQLNLVFF